jgi:anaerobic ribonucleoside-triphosphate reductase
LHPRRYIVATDVRESKKVKTKVEVKVPCEVYSRIVGYLRPIQNWNDGKRQEFKERKTFRVEE